MLVSRKSMFTGKVHTMDLPVTQAQIDELVKGPFKWSHPTKLIQHAFPTLTAEQREFIMTGVTPEEWNAEFGQDSGVESF